MNEFETNPAEAKALNDERTELIEELHRENPELETLRAELPDLD